VYQDAEIYLLDDALSAVDAHVGLHIVNHCIMGLLATKTRVLVTHNLHILPLADVVGVIERGRLKAFGGYAALVADGLDFTKIIPDEVSSVLVIIINFKTALSTSCVPALCMHRHQ
jgi:ABC-type multidrug transport system fused ATPase/permease subunit